MRNNLKKQSAFLFAVSIVLLVGCGPEENREQLKMVNQNLESINVSISYDNREIMETLHNKQKDPQTAELAEEWLPRANKINKYADSLRLMLEGIKSELIAQSDSLKMDYVPVVRQLHNEDGMGSRLFEKLAEFKDSIPVLLDLSEPEKSIYMPKGVPLLPGYNDGLSANDKLQFGKKWLESSFGRSSSLMTMVMLNKIENDVLATGKKVIQYCNNQVYYFCGLGYQKFVALAMLSSSYVKKGQPIEITAGVGGFSDAAKPQITIGDKVIKLNEYDGTAVHRFTANGEPGTHSVMVKIEFYKPDGSREYVTKNLKYTIADDK